MAIHWESSAETIEMEANAALGLADGASPVHVAAFQKVERGPLASRLKRWAEHQRRVLGRTEFGADEVRAQIKRTIHQVRSFGTQPVASRRAMTIHQAKNREFPVVIILWPFEVKGDPVRLRRLLYNAVTRAQRRAIIIVNDPKKERLQAAPFAAIAPSADAKPLPAAPQLPAPPKFYFAYGSNLWEEQMRRRCPGHVKVGKATLTGYRWIISTRGVANLVASPGHTVEGTLFQVSEADEQSLDKFEKVADGAYRKDYHTVTCNGADHSNVLVYVDPITAEGNPRDEYRIRINNGLKDAQLSAAYVESQIRPFIPAPPPKSPAP